MKKQLTWAAFALLFGLLLTVSCTQDADQDQRPPGTIDNQAGAAANRLASTDDLTAIGKESTVEIETKLRFEEAVEMGLEFSHVAGRSPEKFLPETMGGGVIIADFNRDASPDVLFVNSGRFLGSEQTEPADHRLFINRGNGEFSDQTVAWGIRNLGYGMGGVVGDFDNDGWTDLYLTTFDGRDRLLRNTGSSFTDVTEQAGLTSHQGWSTGAGFFDMDHDGDLDLYVVRYVSYDPPTALPCFFQGFHIYCTPVMFEAQADHLFRNNGDGTFTDVSKLAGVPTNGKGLALAIGDIDRDGDSDVYVANDTTANYLLFNDGGGKFEEKAGLLGVGYSSFGNEEAGMGADFSDVNDDGLFDIVCTNYQGETTSVYLQQPEGYFIERSDGIGVGKTARLRLGFGVDFFDADNDGDEELLIANGHIHVDVDRFSTGVGFGQKNTIYEKREDRFVDVTEAAGPTFQTKAPSRGLATGDLDNDGDLDFVVVNNNASAEIALNVTQRLGNFVSLWLEGKNCNRSAIGTVVMAKIGDRRITREVLGASTYLSACDHRVHLGLGTADQIDELLIRWPGGGEQLVSGLAAGAHYHLIEGRDPVALQPGEEVIAPD